MNKTTTNAPAEPGAGHAVDPRLAGDVDPSELYPRLAGDKFGRGDRVTHRGHPELGGTVERVARFGLGDEVVVKWDGMGRDYYDAAELVPEGSA